MREEDRAAARSRWLAEVAHALDAASALADRLRVDPAQRPAFLELLVRIEAARIQTRTLRLRLERRRRRRDRSETDRTGTRDG